MKVTQKSKHTQHYQIERKHEPARFWEVPRALCLDGVFSSPYNWFSCNLFEKDIASMTLS